MPASHDNHSGLIAGSTVLADSGAQLGLDLSLDDWLRVIKAYDGGPAFRRAHYGEDHRDQVRDLWRAVLDDGPVENQDLAQRLCVLPLARKAVILEAVEQAWARIAEDSWTDLRAVLEEILAEAADRVAVGAD